MALEYVTRRFRLAEEGWRNQYTSAAEFLKLLPKTEKTVEKSFRSVLLDSGNEIVIVGHGEYHLPIAV